MCTLVIAARNPLSSSPFFPHISYDSLRRANSGFTSLCSIGAALSASRPAATCLSHTRFPFTVQYHQIPKRLPRPQPHHTLTRYPPLLTFAYFSPVSLIHSHTFSSNKRFNPKLCSFNYFHPPAFPFCFTLIFMSFHH